MYSKLPDLELVLNLRMPCTFANLRKFVLCVIVCPA